MTNFWALFIRLLTKMQMGAELVHMEHVQIHPTGFIDPKDPSAISKILGPEALRGSGGILVNRLGKRCLSAIGCGTF